MWNLNTEWQRMCKLKTQSIENIAEYIICKTFFKSIQIRTNLVFIYTNGKWRPEFIRISIYIEVILQSSARIWNQIKINYFILVSYLIRISSINQITQHSPQKSNITANITTHKMKSEPWKKVYGIYLFNNIANFYLFFIQNFEIIWYLKP